MSSGSATTSQSSGMDPSFAPYLQQYGNFAAGVAANPYQQYNGPRVADLSPLQNQSIGGYQDLLGSNAWGDAGNVLADLGSGSMNPYTDQVEGRVVRGATDAFNRATAGTRTNFNSAGGIGSARSNLAQDRNEVNLATGLGDSLGALRSGAFESSQNRRLQAASAGGSLANTYGGLLSNGLQAGDIPRQQQQQVMSTMYGDWTQANQYPEHQLGILSGALGSLFGAAPRQTTTTGPGSDPVAQGLGIMGLGNYLGAGKSSGGTGVGAGRAG